jgi:hypothetical protein
MEMKRLGFHAKNIVAAGYDPIAGVLAVQFKSSGTYQYSGVPEEKYLKLCRSLYPYRQFMLTVKGKYPVVKPEGENDGKDSIEQRRDGSRDQKRKDSNDAGNTQNTARRDSDSGVGVNHQSGRLGYGHERDAVLQGCVHDSRCNAQSAGGRVKDRKILEWNFSLWE